MLRAVIFMLTLIPIIGLAADMPAKSNDYIAGKYKCTGMDPYSQNNFESIMVISPVAKKIYAISDDTVITHTTQSNVMVFSMRETGILEGNFLAITYQNRRARMEQGVEQMMFNPANQSFYGTWAQLGGNIEGTESCKRDDAPALLLHK